MDFQGASPSLSSLSAHPSLPLSLSILSLPVSYSKPTPRLQSLDPAPSPVSKHLQLVRRVRSPSSSTFLFLRNKAAWKSGETTSSSLPIGRSVLQEVNIFHCVQSVNESSRCRNINLNVFFLLKWDEGSKNQTWGIKDDNNDVIKASLPAWWECVCVSE